MKYTVLALVCVVMSAGSTLAQDQASPDRPNIIFILADDLGWGDLGCYGHPSIKTPNIDRLAAEGTLFTQSYVNGSVCSPSRCAFFTGQYPARHKIHGHYATREQNAARGMSNWLEPAVPNVARLLKQSGYTTAHIGKWHLGNDANGPATAQYGFDFVGTSETGGANGPGADPTFRARSTSIFVDEALRFIDGAKDGPFYLQLWTLVPHATLNPTEEQMRPYQQLRAGGKDFPHHSAAEIFYASVTDLDTQVGRLLAGLAQRGIANSTLVFFSSDNGPEDIHIRNAGHSGVGSAGPFRGRKRSLYEGGIRVPGIVRWPGHVPAGKIDDTSVVAGVDWLPTVCKLAGVQPPAEHMLDGEDASDVFLGGSRARVKPLMWEWRFRIAGEPFHHSPQLATRVGDWKLLMNADRSRVELYQIKQDPTQLDNVAADHPEVVARLSEPLLAWAKTLPDGPRDPGSGGQNYGWPGKRVAEQPRTERPNVVLILLDDVGYSDYGCYGSEVQTPNIDRLAANGLRFTQFYNNAICLPTRASLLTGLYPRYVGPEKRIQLTSEMLTVGELLQSAGYQTSLSGKWHLGGAAPHRPIDRGFGEFFGMLDGCSNHFDPSIPDPPFEGGRLRVWARNAERLTKFPENFYSSDAIADHAIENIRRFARSGKPFFAHVCFTAAHSPLHAKPADVAKYRGKYSLGWDEVRRRRRERQLELGIIDPSWAVPAREPEVKPWDVEPLREWNENLMAVYAAMVDSIDQNIGRIMQALDESGAAQNTVVLVLNDNGGCAEQAGGDDPTNVAGPEECYVSCGAGWAYAQNTPFRRYKGWVHEGGIATPLVVSWPGVTQSGRLTGQVGHVVDLLPTLAEIAGATYPAERNGRRLLPLEGQSLLPVIRGDATSLSQRGDLYWKAFDNRAVRQGRWKLVRDQNAGRWELYDVEADRTETRNLAEQYPERVEQLTAAWNAWADRTGASQQPISVYTLNRVPTNLPPIKIALIGDSTVASYAKPPADRPTLTGWGQVFGLYFQESVEIKNHAVSGRSSKSFLREGRWEPVLAEKPDYVFIQFGHNDQPGKGDRTTDPSGDFQDNLRKCINEARAIGAVPILVTPVARRTFENGEARTTLTPYADAMKAVAKEEKAALVDLHSLSFDLFNERGDEATAWVSASTSDRTHFSRRGAIEIARLAVSALPQAAPQLRHYMRQPWQVPKD